MKKMKKDLGLLLMIFMLMLGGCQSEVSGGCRAAVETSVISIEGLIWRPRGFPRGIEEAKGRWSVGEKF